jgi:iron complex outermembrane receptor protein
MSAQRYGTVAAKRVLAGSVSAAAMMWALPAVAADEVAEIEEVIVTAQRRAENLQDVPISVTALAGATLERRGATQLGDFLKGVPGVSFMSTGPTGNRGDTRQITIRGITPSAFDPAFGFYLDDAPLPTGDPKLFDISRVEVLRGPQGTLYGLGTSGGAIKIIPNAPNLDDEENAFSTRAYTISKGSTGFEANGMYNAPIIPGRLAVRLVGFHNEHSGYIDRVALPAALGAGPLGAEAVAGTRANAKDNVDDLSVTGFRIAADFKATDRLSIKPSFFHQTAEVDARPTFDVNVGDLKQAREVNTYEKQEIELAALKVEYALPFADLTSITSQFVAEDHNNEDLTNLVRLAIFRPRGLTFPGYAQMLVTRERVSFVQELRLASNAEGPLSWLVGGFFQRQRQGPADGERILNGRAPGLTAAAAFFPFQNDTFVTNTSYAHIREKSAFGEVSYALTDALRVTAGLRYFDIEINRTVDRGGFFNGFVALDGNPLIRTRSKDDGLRPKLSVSYDVSDDVMVFATASQGFRRGGVNEGLPAAVCSAELAQRGFPGAPQGFSADSLWNYEVGFKGQFAERRVTLNATAFQIDWSKIQQRVVLNCGFAFTTNVGDARSRGVEVDLRLRPVDGLDVSAGLGYTDAEITKVPATFPSAAFRPGMRLQNVPKLTFNAAAQYTWRVSGSADGFVSGDLSYVDDRFYVIDATQPFGGRLKSFTQVNLRAGVNFGGKELALFVDNLTDARPVLNVDSFGTTALNPSAYTLQPRTIGVSLRGSF